MYRQKLVYDILKFILKCKERPSINIHIIQETSYICNCLFELHNFWWHQIRIPLSKPCVCEKVMW